MSENKHLLINHPLIGICGLSCRLCPRYHTDAESKCHGCKSEYRMSAGCPFITCAIKKKGIEFCMDCDEKATCGKWRAHRQAGMTHDSFKCYQRLENNIAFIEEHGIAEFAKAMDEREGLLKRMLEGYNEGRSKSYYCIAATVMDVGELQTALNRAQELSGGMSVKDKAKVLRTMLDEIAHERGYILKLRKR